MSNRNSESISIGFVPALLLAMLVIGFCYRLVLETVAPDTPGTVIGLLALLGSLVFYALLVFSARVGSDERSLANRAKIGASLLLLYTCSGYGISSTYMLLYEGPNILREHIARTTDAYARLRTAADRDLPVPEYEQMVMRVRSNMSGLLREIHSSSGGRYCGVGASARQYIAEIARDLEGFRELNGSDRQHDCTDAAKMKKIADSYVKDIEERLRNHPMVSAKGVVARKKLQADIADYSEYHSQKLKEELAKLSGLGNLLLNYGLFSSSSAMLQTAASDYAALAHSLRSVGGKAASGVPSQIDVSMLHRLSSGFEIPTVLFERLNKLVTWVAFLLPLLGDLAYARFARLVLDKYRRALRMIQQMTIGGSNVVYLLRPLGDDA